MIIEDAKAIADQLAAAMRPHCHRIEIAGSIRRGSSVVKDIELVAVPKRRPLRQTDTLFDDLSRDSMNALFEWAVGDGRRMVRWIKPGTAEVVDWQLKPEGKYWRGLVNNEIKLDLFLTTVEHWGLIYLIRTGSAEFSQAVMTYARHRTSYHVEGGQLRARDGQALETHEERDVFDALRLDWVEPHERTGQQMVMVNGHPQFKPKEVN